MNTALIIQTFVLSGALGFVSLEYLQDHNAVTRSLSDASKNTFRVALGALDYMIYLIVYALVGICHMHEIAQVIVSILTTVILVVIYLALFSKYANGHTVFSNGAIRLDVRERAFENPGEGPVQADVFDLQGKYIGSGLVHDVNLESGVARDVSLLPLPDGYRANSDTASAVQNTHLRYLDTQNGLQYFFTYFSV